MFLWEVTFKQGPQWSEGASYLDPWEEIDTDNSMQSSHGGEIDGI